jgi:hypothetical protein
MKLSIAILAAVGSCFAASAAFAQTCAAPIAILSNSDAAGDTCTAENTLPGYGGISSPQAEIVYSFVAEGANATVTMTHTGAAFGGTVVVMPSPCSSSTDIITAGDTANPMAVNGLTDGETYYVIATADPGGPADACGAYNLNVDGILPVELQNFSVE